MKITPAALVLGGLLGVTVVAGVILAVSKPANLAFPVPKNQNPPPATSGASLPVLADHMPEFAKISGWLNSDPLTAAQLKGKVVLVDFWTYSCINCIRTQPVLKAWWSAYEKDGFVIVGVHTPEFAFEKVPANIADAVAKAGLKYPIAIDSDYGTWNNYSNQYWPAEYLFDREGRLRHTHFGEGEYDETESAIRALLAENGTKLGTATGADSTPNFGMTATNETYFGYARATNFVNLNERKKDQLAKYTLKEVGADEWSLGGSWLIDKEKATCMSDECSFRMSIASNAMHLVLAAPVPSTVNIFADERIGAERHFTAENETTDAKISAEGLGEAGQSLGMSVQEHRLYRVVQFPNDGRHTMDIRLQKGVEFYAATFGM